jgi:hypothetical protein
MNELTKAITLRLPVTTIDYMRRLARSYSIDEDDNITAADLIRRSIKQMYCHNPCALMSETEKAKVAYEMSRCDSGD